jgi:hypothetical protein
MGTETMEHDGIVLKKILNSNLFLGKYPMITRVEVDPYGKGIDIVLIPNNTQEYWDIKKEIHSYVWELSKLASVTSRFNIYP